MEIYQNDINTYYNGALERKRNEMDETKTENRKQNETIKTIQI